MEAHVIGELLLYRVTVSSDPVYGTFSTGWVAAVPGDCCESDIEAPCADTSSEVCSDTLPVEVGIYVLPCGDIYTLDASISDQTLTCDTLLDGLDTSNLNGETIEVSAMIEGNLIQLKKLIGDAYSDTISFTVANYSGGSYGFQEVIFADVDYSDIGKDIIISCRLVGASPTVLDTAIKTISPTLISSHMVNTMSDPNVDGLQYFGSTPHSTAGLYYSAWVSGAWSPNPALPWNTNLEFVMGVFTAVGVYDFRYGTTGYASKAAAIAASAGMHSAVVEHDGTVNIGLYVPDSGWGDNSDGGPPHLYSALYRLW